MSCWEMHRKSGGGGGCGWDPTQRGAFVLSEKWSLKNEILMQLRSSEIESRISLQQIAKFTNDQKLKCKGLQNLFLIHFAFQIISSYPYF